MYFYATSNCFKYKCNALNENLDYDLMDFIFKKIVHWRLCYRFSVQLTDSYQKDVGCSLVLSYTGAGTPVLLYLTSAACSGSWGREIKEKEKFPFEADEKFTIEIIFREDRYEVCGF